MGLGVGLGVGVMAAASTRVVPPGAVVWLPPTSGGGVGATSNVVEVNRVLWFVGGGTNALTNVLVVAVGVVVVVVAGVFVAGLGAGAGAGVEACA